MDKRVIISVSGAMAVPLDELIPFQGDLKDLSDENRRRLRGEILTTGFAFAPHVWKSPEDGKFYLLDGHQRCDVLRGLKVDGYEVPPIPIAVVDAPTAKDAKRRILQASSSYGEITAQGLYDFMLVNDLTFEEVKVSFDLPSIDMDKFNSFFQKPEDNPSATPEGSKEIQEGEFSNLVHTCPACGHKFGKGG